MKKIRRYFVAGSVLIILAAACLFAVVRENLLVDRYSEKVDKREGNQFYWMRKMVEAGPVGTRRVLQLCRDGSYDGDIEQISAYILMYADHDVYPYVSALFSDSDPETRGYASLVAGHLGDKRYLPHLQRLTKDETPLPEGWFTKTVAERARCASGWISDGLPGSKEIRRAVEELTSQPEEGSRQATGESVRKSDEFQIRRAAFHLLLSSHGWKTSFLAIGIDSIDSGEGPSAASLPEKFADPSDELMRQFRGHVPVPQKYSQCSDPGSPVVGRSLGGRGIILFVGPIYWITDKEVEVNWGFYIHSLAAGGGLCRLVKENGRWVCREKKTDWIS